jgi:HK97 family phage major capsid protein
MAKTDKDVLKAIKDQLGTVVEQKIREAQDQVPPSDGYAETIKKEVEKAFKDFQLESNKLQGQNEKTANKSGFESIGDFLHKVVIAGKDISLEDDRLKQIKSAGEAIGGDSEYGAYLIPEEFRLGSLQPALEQSNFIKKTTLIPMATNAITMPSLDGYDRSTGTLFGGIKFYWLDSEDEIPTSRPKFDKVNLKLNACAGMAYLNGDMIADSPVSIAPYITSRFVQAYPYEIDGILIDGKGSGKPLGILNAPCKITIPAEAGQKSTELDFQNIVKMYSRFSNMSGGKGTMFIANRTTLPALVKMNTTVGTAGAPVWIPSGGISGKPYNTLMGLPLFFSEHCNILGTEGDIILVDWSQVFRGEKTGSRLEVATSMHVAFLSNQSAIRFYFRMDAQPGWLKPVSPKKGDTISFIVTLATRPSS